MKKYLVILVTALVTLTASTKANNPLSNVKATIGPELRMNIGNNLDYNAGLIYGYQHKLSHEKFDEAIDLLLTGNNVYFQHPQATIDAIEETFKFVLDKKEVSIEELREINRQSTYIETPEDMKKTYKVAMFKKDGSGIVWAVRKPYRTGDKLANGELCPRDESGKVFGEIMWIVDGCGNPTCPYFSKKPDEPNVYNVPDTVKVIENHYYTNTITNTIHDTTFTPANGGNANNNNNNVYVYGGGGCSTCGSNQQTAPKKGFHDTWLGGMTENAVGGTIAVVAGGAILHGIYKPQPNVVYRDNTQVIRETLPQTQTNPQTYPNDFPDHQQSSGGTSLPNGGSIPNDPPADPPTTGGHSWLVRSGSNAAQSTAQSFAQPAQRTAATAQSAPVRRIRQFN